MSASLPVNTPGYYYALAYWGSAAIIAMNNRRRFGGRRLIPYALISFLVLFGFMTVTDGVERRLFPLCMAVILLIIFIFMHGIGDYSVRESAFYCMSVFICGEFCASLCWQLYYYMVTEGRWPHTAWIQGGELLVIYAAVFTAIYLLARYLRSDAYEAHITVRELLVAVTIVAATFVVSNLSYLGTDSPFTSDVTMDIYIIRTLVDLSGAVMLYAYQIQMREVQMRFERETLRGILQMQYQAYRHSRESIDIVNRKYHDLKHQIVLLRDTVQSEQAHRYLDQMEKEIRGYETQNRTGNKVLDAVLTSKSIYCQNHDIELKYMVQGELLDFMDNMDVSALFGNMLDNAIESVEKQKEREKRLVWLYVQQEKQFLRIRTENYCDEKLSFLNSMPVTTKKDRNLHGYGVKSIRYTVEKYGGSAVARQEDNWFKLNILIPIAGSPDGEGF